MGKLVRTNTVYVWPKDSEYASDYIYTVYTDDEYKEICEEYGVNTLKGYFDGDDYVEKIQPSEDSYSSQGECNDVCDIPDDKVAEIQKIIDDMGSLINKLNILFK